MRYRIAANIAMMQGNGRINIMHADYSEQMIRRRLQAPFSSYRFAVTQLSIFTAQQQRTSVVKIALLSEKIVRDRLGPRATLRSNTRHLRALSPMSLQHSSMLTHVLPRIGDHLGPDFTPTSVVTLS